MNETLFAPVANGSLRARVQESIKQAILSGKLSPGETLREMQLAKSFQVSQATVREALMQLERVGLVVRTENRHTAVIKLSKQDVRNRLAVRVPLEILAATEASERMTEVHHRKLDELNENISRTVLSDSYFGTTEADLDFHRFIWKRSENQELYQVLNQVTVPLFAAVLIVRSLGAEKLKEVVRSHEPIIAAMKKKKPGAIEDAVRFHIQTSYDHFLS